MTIGSPRARFSASLRRVTGLRSSRLNRGSRGGEDTEGSFRVGAPAFRGRRPLDEDVVDQSGAADRGGDGDEGARVLERVGGPGGEGLGGGAGGEGARPLDLVGVRGGEVLGGDAVLLEHRFAGLQTALRRGAQGGTE